MAWDVYFKAASVISEKAKLHLWESKNYINLAPRIQYAVAWESACSVWASPWPWSMHGERVTHITRGAVRNGMVEVSDKMQSRQLHPGNMKNGAGKINDWNRKWIGNVQECWSPGESEETGGYGVGKHKCSGSLCWFRGRRVKHLDLRLSLS